jgi:glycosyltransferase involved in cell wall biosynthesis
MAMPDFHPLVSIVIPVYNGSNYMQCAIDSALGQEYDNIEVIVVNDGSTDNTDAIAKSYGDKIRYFSKENGGVSTALNLAIENAKGEYISWLSHDDYYLPNKVSRQIEELGKVGRGEKLIVCCGCKYLDSIKNIDIISLISDYGYNILTKIEILKILYAYQVHGCSFLIPMEAFKSVGYFNPELRITQDYYLWFKFIDAGYLFFYIPEVLMVGRIHIQQVGIVTKQKLCYYEELKLWDFANKLFYNDIKKASKKDKRILKKKQFQIHIKRFIYLHCPVLVREMWNTIKSGYFLSRHSQSVNRNRKYISL